MARVYFELADASGEKVVPRLLPMRLCRELEVLKTDILEPQLQHIYNLCDIAIRDENRFFMFDDAWLKITISLKDSGRFLEELFSIAELTEMIRNGSDISRENGEELEPEITIRRNVLPRKGEWKHLYDLFHCEYWNRLRIHQESLGEDGDAAPSNQMGEPSTFQEVQSPNHHANQNRVLHAVNSSEVLKVKRLRPGSDRDVQCKWTKPLVHLFVRLRVEGNCHIINHLECFHTWNRTSGDIVIYHVHVKVL